MPLIFTRQNGSYRDGFLVPFKPFILQTLGTSSFRLSTVANVLPMFDKWSINPKIYDGLAKIDQITYFSTQETVFCFLSKCIRQVHDKK